MNLFDRYQRDPLGFDSFNTWMRNYEKLHAKFPLGCAKVGEEWLALWGALGELLAMDVEVASWSSVTGWIVIGNGTLAECLRDCAEVRSVASRGHLRIIALDGTIIKEWGPRESDHFLDKPTRETRNVRQLGLRNMACARHDDKRPLSMPIRYSKALTRASMVSLGI